MGALAQCRVWKSPAGWNPNRWARMSLNTRFGISLFRSKKVFLGGDSSPSHLAKTASYSFLWPHAYHSQRPVNLDWGKWGTCSYQARPQKPTFHPKARWPNPMYTQVYGPPCQESLTRPGRFHTSPAMKSTGKLAKCKSDVMSFIRPISSLLQRVKPGGIVKQISFRKWIFFVVRKSSRASQSLDYLSTAGNVPMAVGKYDQLNFSRIIAPASRPYFRWTSLPGSLQSMSIVPSDLSALILSNIIGIGPIIGSMVPASLFHSVKVWSTFCLAGKDTHIHSSQRDALEIVGL